MTSHSITLIDIYNSSSVHSLAPYWSLWQKSKKSVWKKKFQKEILNFFLCYFSKSLKETMAKGKKQRKNQDSDDET